MSPWITLILGVLGGGGIAGLTGAYVQVRKVRPEIKRSDTESAETVVQMAVNLLAPYEQSVKRLHERVDQLEAHIYMLEGQLIAAGITPHPRPPTLNPTGEP